MSSPVDRKRLSSAATMLTAFLIAGVLYFSAYKGLPYLLIALPTDLRVHAAGPCAMLFYPLRKLAESKRPPKVQTLRVHEVRSGYQLVAKDFDPLIAHYSIFHFDASQAVSVSSLKKGDLIEVTFVWRPRFRDNQAESWLVTVVKK